MSDLLVGNVHKQALVCFVLSYSILLNIDCSLVAAAAAGPGNFQCPANQNHILCQCCIQPMPDRRDEADIHQHCK
jgi:hypothetical protein